MTESFYIHFKRDDGDEGHAACGRRVRTLLGVTTDPRQVTCYRCLNTRQLMRLVGRTKPLKAPPDRLWMVKPSSKQLPRNLKCVVCGKTFYRNFSRQNTCSVKCRGIVRERRNAAFAETRRVSVRKSR